MGPSQNPNKSPNRNLRKTNSMDGREIERQIGLVRAIIDETRASCRLCIAQVNRVMHEYPECEPIDVTPLYTAIDLCGKIDLSLQEHDVETAIRLIAKLKNKALLKE